MERQQPNPSGRPPSGASPSRGEASCLEVERLAPEYAEDLLGGEERTRVEEHLASCAACSSAMAEMRVALAICRSAEGLVVPPGLVARILEQTTGKLSWKDRLRVWVRPVLEPRLALGLAMALISFSIVLRAAGVDPTNLALDDFRPSNIYERLDRKAHLTGSRVVKYYRDLRIVYEIQTQLQAIRESNAPSPAPRPPAPQQKPQDQRPSHNRWSRQSDFLASAENGPAGGAGMPDGGAPGAA